ncbi:hypothetical protein ACQ4PT_026450 [Festuca glaucescens]
MRKTRFLWPLKPDIRRPAARFIGSSTISPLELPPNAPADLITMDEVKSVPDQKMNTPSDGLLIMDKDHLTSVLEVDKATQKEYTTVKYLQEQFALMKSAFVCRGILSPYKLNDPETQFLNEGYRKIHGRYPKHMTAYTAMKNFQEQALDYRKHCLDYLSNIGAIVTNEWGEWDEKAHRPALYIRSTMVEVGPSFPPDGTPYLRGECDGSYNRANESAGIGIALWNKLDILLCEIALDFWFPKEKGSLLAEATAMALLLKRGMELTDYLAAYTDSKDVERVMRDGFHKKEGQDPIFDLLPFMRGYFKKFAVRWVSRDGLKLVVSLQKNPHKGLDKQWAAELIKGFKEHLAGVPVFSHVGSTVQVGELKTPMNLYEDTCYIEAKPDEKLDTLKHVVKKIVPDKVRIVGKDVVSWKEEVVKLFCHNRSGYSVSSNDSDCIDIDFGTSETPKILCLCLDGDLPKAPYHLEKYALTVLVVSSDQKKRSNLEHIGEFSPLSYISFKLGVPGSDGIVAKANLKQSGSGKNVAKANLIQSKKVIKGVDNLLKPKMGDYVKVNYSFFHEGKLVETNHDSGVPYEFRLGEGKVKGWDEAISSMNRGERSTFTIPPVLGYGEVGSLPAIPPNATLHLDVELIHYIRMTDISKDGSVMKLGVTKGKNSHKPKDFDVVKVKYEIRLKEDGSLVSKSEGEGVEFTVKDGFMCPAIAVGVKAMLKMGLKKLVEWHVAGKVQYHLMPV